MGGTCSTYGERRGACGVLVRKSERRSHMKDRHRWEVNIKLDIQEVGWGVMDQIVLA
jgi:hypothetical protein